LHKRQHDGLKVRDGHRWGPGVISSWFSGRS
jgi:hypothetical protein